MMWGRAVWSQSPEQSAREKLRTGKIQKSPELALKSPEVSSKSAPSRSKVCPKSAQSRPKVCPKLAKSWPKVCPKSAQSRPKVGPKSAKSRFKVGSKSAKAAPKSAPKSPLAGCSIQMFRTDLRLFRTVLHTSMFCTMCESNIAIGCIILTCCADTPTLCVPIQKRGESAHAASSSHS